MLREKVFPRRLSAPFRGWLDAMPLKDMSD